MKNSKTQSAPEQRDHWAAGIHSRPTKTRATLNVCLLAWFACASPVFAADASALVDIPDPSLRAAIRLTLRKAGPITAADMETIRTLDVSRSRLGYAAPIRSLEGLQAARNLQSLNLAGVISSLVSLDPEYEELYTVVAPWELTPWQLGVRPPPSTALETADLSPLAHLSSLRSLKLSGNGLTNLVVPGGLTNLQELDLSLNFQPEISSLASRPNLERLGLKFCAVTNVSFLGSMTNLRSLDLSWNYLPDFTVPAGLEQIEELTLDRMGLARFVCDAGSPKLRTLSLCMNKLANASFLGGLTNLRSLNLDWNKLPDFELPPGLGQIEHLSLNWLGLTNLVLDAGITNVRSLSLSFNALTSLTFVASMRELRSLSLGGNRVDNLGFLTNLTALENLSLGGCRVTQTEEILPHLQSLTRLQTLDLSDMGLSGSMVLSSEMTELKILFLQRNHLTTLTVPASLTNLEVLHASYNTLTHVDLPMGVVRLGTIDLSYNQLSSFSLPPNASAVKRMNFRGNPMASLDIAASQNCLQDIDISFTQVTNLDFLNGFEKLQTFGFFGNASARLVFPDGLRRLRVLLLHNYCYGGGCHWSGTENAFDTVELPASVNVAELITRGFPRDRIIIRGLWMHSPVVTSNGQVTLRINGASGHEVQVQSSTNLVDWDNWQSVVLGTNGAELVDEPSAGPMRYYRLVQLPADER